MKPFSFIWPENFSVHVRWMILAFCFEILGRIELLKMFILKINIIIVIINISNRSPLYCPLIRGLIFYSTPNVSVSAWDLHSRLFILKEDKKEKEKRKRKKDEKKKRKENKKRKRKKEKEEKRKRKSKRKEKVKEKREKRKEEKEEKKKEKIRKRKKKKET